MVRLKLWAHSSTSLTIKLSCSFQCVTSDSGTMTTRYGVIMLIVVEEEYVPWL